VIVPATPTISCPVLHLAAQFRAFLVSFPVPVVVPVVQVVVSVIQVAFPVASDHPEFALPGSQFPKVRVLACRKRERTRLKVRDRPVVVPVAQVVVPAAFPVAFFEDLIFSAHPVAQPVAFLVSMVFPMVVAIQKRADYHEQTPDLTGLSETFLGMVVDSVGGVPPMTLPVVASLSHSNHREWYILTSSPPLGMVNSPVVFHLLIPLLGLDTPF